MDHTSRKTSHFYLVGLGKEGYRELLSYQNWQNQQQPPENVKFHYIYPCNLPVDSSSIGKETSLNYPAEFQTTLLPEQRDEWLEKQNIKKPEFDKLPLEENPIWARMLLAANKDRIEILFRGAFASIKSDSDVNIFVLGGLGDPVVRGTLIDLAMIIKKALDLTPFNCDHLIGVFRLPGIPMNGLEYANTYAILKDLNYNQQAGQLEVYHPSLISGQSMRMEQPPLDRVVLLPAISDEHSSGLYDPCLAEWIIHQNDLNSSQTGLKVVFPDKKGISPNKLFGNFGCIGLSSIGPVLSFKSEDFVPVIMGMLERSIPALKLSDAPAGCLGNYHWTIYANTSIWQEKSRLQALLRQTLKTLTDKWIGHPYTCEDELPQTTITVLRSDRENITCICEYTDFKVDYLKDVASYRSDYKSLVSGNQYPEIDNSGAVDLISFSHTQTETLFTLTERKIRSGKIVVASTPPEKIEADFLVAPFSGDIDRPGEFSSQIIESAGQEARRQIALSLADMDANLHLEGDLMRVSGGNTGARTLLLIKQNFYSDEKNSIRIKNLIEKIFVFVPSSQPVTIVLPLLSLEILDPQKTRELADCMLEAISGLLSSKTQELVVILSVQQPEAVAELVHAVTEENLLEKHEEKDKEHKIARELPYPIAKSYRHYIYARQWDKEVSTNTDQLLTDTLIFLASIAFCEYFSKAEPDQREDMGRILLEKRFLSEKMEFGKWVGILRELGKELLTKSDLFLPEGIDQIYKDNGKLSAIVTARNNWRKRKSQQSYDGLLIDFIDRLGFFSKYILVYIEASLPDASLPRYSCFELTGCDPAFEHAYLECDLQLNMGVYLVNIEGNEVLDMYPMLKAQVMRGNKKYNWLLLYTPRGFSGGLSNGKLVYDLRTLEHCLYPLCAERKKIEEDGDMDGEAKKYFNALFTKKGPDKQILRRQKAGYLRFLSPEEVRGSAGH